MPIEESTTEDGGALVPVIKATAIGQKFVGAICAKTERRDVLGADGKPKLKDNGKARQELVVTCLAMPGTTAVTGKAGEERAIEPGDVVRFILKGGAYSEWIEAENTHKERVTKLGARPGDVVEREITHAQAWNEDATKRGGQLFTQAEADSVPRGVSLGYYGPLTIRAATPAEAEWDAKACAIYTDGQRPQESASDPFPADNGVGF